MKLAVIADTILDETSTPEQLRRVLREFSQLCSHAGGVAPNSSFDAWAEDSFLGSGVAINSQAAAHCVTDYRRTVVFLRGINAALKELLERFPSTPIRILYAGCGPYATLLLPLLARFDPERIDLTLLDIHQKSLDSVVQLIEFFGYQNFHINLQRADACDYQHSEPLHLIVAEVMQKALEQEPQFAVTVNLAPQLNSGGIFIPQKIEVELSLASLDLETHIFNRDGVVAEVVPGLVAGKAPTQSGARVPLGNVFTLLPEQATALAKTATKNQRTGKLELVPTVVSVSHSLDTASYDLLFFTRIAVFAHYHLSDYEAEITLPLRCSELAHVQAGESYKVSYELGGYPKFTVVKV